MTAYTIAHLMVAALCALLAALHLALWVALPRDKAQGWSALSFAAFGGMNIAIGLSSTAAGPEHREPMFLWIVLAMVSVLPLLAGPIRVSQYVVGRPMMRGRRLLERAVVAIWVVRVLDVLRLYLTLRASGEEITFERVSNSLQAPSVLPLWGFAIIAGTIAFQEAIDELGRRTVAGWVLVAVSVPATVFSIREVLMCFGLAGGPTFAGLLGLPFMVLTSALVVMRYVDSMRRQVQGVELSGYQLIRRLSQGGMGELYLAARVGPAGFERHVALKRILPQREDPTAVERFLTEGRVASQLRHPNIIAVHDIGKLEDGGWFLAMEYLAGASAQRILERSRDTGRALPIPFVLAVGEQVAQGLAHAHASGVVHRDVSPSNVMVTFDGAVKLIDFGIAYETGTEARTTASGKVVGKSLYIAPERLIQGVAGEPMSDVYSLAVMLYELVCGVRPFQARNPLELAREIRSGRFLPMSFLRPEVPRAVEEIVTRALSADPFGRGSAAELADLLGRAKSRLPEVPLGEFVRDLCSDAWGEEMRVRRWNRLELTTAST